MNLLKNLKVGFQNINDHIKSLIDNFKSKLSAPYYSSTKSLRGLLYAFGVALAVYLIFYILQPFGIDNLPNQSDVIIISSVISFVGMILAEFLLPLLISDYYADTKWTMAKQIVQLILMVFLVTGGIAFYLDQFTAADISFGEELFKALLYSILPILAFSLFQHNWHTKKYTEKAEELNEILAKKPVISNDSNISILHFKGSNNILNLIPNQLIYVKISSSSSNFYYQQPLGIANMQIDIKEEYVRHELDGHPQFVAFRDDIILNANAIQKISGNAGGFEVGIARVNEHIKVANSYKKNIEKL